MEREYIFDLVACETLKFTELNEGGEKKFADSGKIHFNGKEEEDAIVEQSFVSIGRDDKRALLIREFKNKIKNDHDKGRKELMNEKENFFDSESFHDDLDDDCVL